ncbi:hypothetical protein [Vulcaniibacterium thermophilum]|uniref:Uncharacterized protein n=1 Tax=Vulcaniibacterium thermophilum TaxID=1169913 RepID=A0A918YWW8_9GAMM|nr:hypothetical protein [Vulcaniibacterium thermophilum]GHE26500.1 hypothetical protein GCM10007167_04710 [Vulcaniibacterium thermophilum]
MTLGTDRMQLLQQMEAMLQEQPGLSEADRAAVIREVREALERHEAAPATLDVAALRDAWLSLVDRFGEELDASERDALARRIEQAFEPLQHRAVQDALEYERRRKAEGDAPAAEWLARRNREHRSASAGQVDVRPGA